MPRVNTNLVRSLTGGVGIGTEIFESALTTGQTPTIQRAVVVDVITDPDILTSAYVEKLRSQVNNPDLAGVMIPNCVLATLAGSAGGTGPENLTILFPLYPSHLMLPIAPGEQVYVIYEDIVVSGTRRGYWLSRIPGYNTFEDPNYTHLDRRFDPTTNPANYSTLDIDDRPDKVSPEKFQNGGNTPETRTIPQKADKANPYDYIIKNSSAAAFITPEPVPRWKKRPQELVLQGANNALIMLGEDRNGPIDGALVDPPYDITKTLGNPRYAGAIDIVAGRGRYVPEPNADPRLVSRTNPPGSLSTAPLVVENTRGFLETNKNPFRSRLESKANPFEGNPDPLYDAARVYVVQQSRVDENYFLVPINNAGLEYPEGAIANEQPIGTGSLGRSYVVNKADNIRIIARREPQVSADVATIDGSILIVREGAKNENDISADPDTAPTAPDGTLAYIYFNKEGKVQIEANEIYLGRGTGKEQPYVRYSVYKKTIETLQDEINSLRDHIGNLEQTLETAFQTAVAVPYSNIASLFALGNNVLRNTVNFRTLDNDIQQADDKIKNTYNENVKSTKIFGE